MKKRRWMKRKTKERLAVLLVVGGVLLALAASGGRFVYAKYFSQEARFGVAIASGVYFTANHAAESDSFIESSVGGYSGNSQNFKFEVYNYENNLLFNESGVEIGYSVAFWLEKEPPAGVTYTVTAPGGAVKSITADKGAPATFTEQVIGGGSALSNQYSIDIAVGEGVTAPEGIPIYVQVITSEGGMISKTLRGKMVFGTVVGVGNYIETQSFVPEGSNETETEEEQYNMLMGQSAFTYEIRTVGETSGAVTEKLKLAWDPNVLEIDLFDDAYLEWEKWLDSATEAEKTALGEFNETLNLPKDNAAGHEGWVYITIKALPYSAEHITFFRGKGFNAATNVTNLESMNSYVQATTYGVSAVAEDVTE